VPGKCQKRYEKVVQKGNSESCSLTPITMARLSLVALLALALTGVAQGNPSGQQQLSDGRVHTSEGWEYAVCGQSLLS
jgi:hypothetical protein